MRIYIHILLIAILAGGFGISCAEDEKFSSDPALKLTFSRDTIAFDTVFATVGSTVSQFKIFNRNDKSLTIRSIEVVDPENSGFSLNIDGVSGTKISDLDILRKDSLYGFVRVTVNPQKENAPVVIRDSIRFVTNDNIQYLVLEAIGRNVHILKDVSFEKDTLLSNDKPYLIYGGLNVAEYVSLTLDRGVEFFFHDKASMLVAGRLMARGTVEERIIMRGDRLDKMNGIIPYDNVPGQWGGITFTESSSSNLLENVVVKNAITGMDFRSEGTAEIKAILNNVVIHSSSGYGLLASNSKIEAVNCQFTNARQSVLSLNGGIYDFVHCTIANYYQWSMREGYALSIVSSGSEEVYRFANSIVYGSMQNELSIPNLDNLSEKLSFQNCLIKNKKEFVTSQFKNIIWNQDPAFLSINESGFYDYNFVLTDKSPARDSGNSELSFGYPFDMNGVARLADTAPDLGCFEYVAE